MLAKKIFFFWENNSLSWARYMTLRSFRKYNPDWKMELYLSSGSEVKSKTWKDSPTQDFHSYCGKNYLNDLEKLDIDIIPWKLPDEAWNKKVGPSHKSNFFKYQKLGEMGGIYSDLDILFVKPIDSHYKQICEFDTSICYHNNYFSIGLLSSAASNRFFNEAYKMAYMSWSPDAYQSAGVNSLYNLLKQKEGIDMSKEAYDINLWFLLKKYYPELSIINVDMKVVYPWKYNQMSQVFEKTHTNLPENTIGIHWYAGDRISQACNNIMDSENYIKYDNTFCYFARKILK